jgi:hypothetical protein
MSPKELTAFRIEPEIMEGLRRVKERDGIPLSVQVHRALMSWLDAKGIKTKAAPRRAPSRRKARTEGVSR